MRKRIFAVFASLLILSAGAAGPVAADTGSSLGECSSLLSFIQNAAVMGLTGTYTDDCSPTNDQVEQMKQDDAAQEKLDIYQSVTSDKAAYEAISAQTSNTLNDSQQAAWMKMQVAVAEAYQNGSSKANAKIAAKEAIKEYYSVKEENIVRQAETRMVNLKYLQEVAVNESGIGTKYMSIHTDHPDGSEYDGQSYISGTQNQTYTLLDGDQITYTSLTITVATDSTEQGSTAWGPQNAGGDYYTGNNDLGVSSVLDIGSAGDGYPSMVAVDMANYGDDLNEIEQKSTDLQAEADNFVENTYASFDSGETNASDVISANTAMFEYGTQADENSSLYDSTAALTLMGYDTPNMSSTGTMDVTYKGNTWTGIVLARNAPDGSWETGTTYNTSNITGPVFLATTDGKKVDFEDAETFTIEQMRNRDGENTTSIDTTQYVYKTANTSELNEMQNDLTDLRQEIESREPDGGGGSGSGLNSSMMIGIAALAGAALLLGGRE